MVRIYPLPLGYLTLHNGCLVGIESSQPIRATHQHSGASS